MRYTFIFTLAVCWQQLSATHLVNALASNAVALHVSGANAKEIPANFTAQGDLPPKLQWELQNNTAGVLQLEIEEGYFMEPVEQGYQTLLMTQPLMITLQPKTKKKEFVYAMCSALSRSSPNSSTKYKLGKKAPDAMVRLAKFIAQKKYQHFAAQQAVWSLSDGSPVTSISSSNSAVEDDLLKIAAELKGLNYEEVKRQKASQPQSQFMQSFNGKKADRNIIFRNDSTASVSVAFFSQSGEVLKSFIDETAFQPGHHSIRINPFPVSLTGKTYSVRMMKNGEIFREYYFMQ